MRKWGVWPVGREEEGASGERRGLLGRQEERAAREGYGETLTRRCEQSIHCTVLKGLKSPVKG